MNSSMEAAASRKRWVSVQATSGLRFEHSRILIVDDIVTNRDIVTKLLTSEGAICEAVENGRAAVERLRAGPGDFDCVLMDVQMPEMDGLEATRVLREDLGLVDLPVIALTAGAMAGQRDAALAAGMNGFIGKPFRLRELVAALAPWRTRERQAAPGNRD